MVNTTQIGISYQQYSIVSKGAVSISEGEMSNLVEASLNFLTIYTGTTWGPITLTVTTDERVLQSLDEEQWEAVEQGEFYCSAPLHVETNDGQVWSEFTELGLLPPVGQVAFKVLARGRALCWGRDIDEAVEEHLVIIWPTAKPDEPIARSVRLKSDGKNTGGSSERRSSAIPDVSDARVRTIGPYIFGSE